MLEKLICRKECQVWLSCQSFYYFCPLKKFFFINHETQLYHILRYRFRSSPVHIGGAEKNQRGYYPDRLFLWWKHTHCTKKYSISINKQFES